MFSLKSPKLSTVIVQSIAITWALGSFESSEVLKRRTMDDGQDPVVYVQVNDPFGQRIQLTSRW